MTGYPLPTPLWMLVVASLLKRVQILLLFQAMLCGDMDGTNTGNAFQCSGKDGWVPQTNPPFASIGCTTGVCSDAVCCKRISVCECWIPVFIQCSAAFFFISLPCCLVATSCATPAFHLPSNPISTWFHHRTIGHHVLAQTCPAATPHSENRTLCILCNV